jgi:broad specificity phosphatase PhoE
MRLPMTEPRQIWVPYPGAESWATMNTRIYQTMDEIDADVPHTAIIVGHSLAGNSIIHWWLALCDDCQSCVAYRLQPGGITRLGLNVWDERTIWLLNDTCHLQDTHC